MTLTDTATARTLYVLAGDHKAVCPGESCTVSLFFLRALYLDLVKRPLTDDEIRRFM
jgi:hypothetical protein